MLFSSQFYILHSCMFCQAGGGPQLSINHYSHRSHPTPVLQLMQISLTAIINVTDAALCVCVVKMLQRCSKQKRRDKTRWQESSRIQKSPVVLSREDVTRGHSCLQSSQCALEWQWRHIKTSHLLQDIQAKTITAVHNLDSDTAYTR